MKKAQTTTHTAAQTTHASADACIAQDARQHISEGETNPERVEKQARQLSWNDYPAIAEAIKAGEVGILLVDTIYGFVGLRATASRIEAIKGRGADHPFIWLLSEEDALRYSAHEIPAALKHGFPGAITVITDIAEDIACEGSASDHSQAIRAPQGTAAAMLKLVGEPIISTSANISGTPYVGDIALLQELFGSQVDFIVVGGPKEAPEGSTLPSTIVDIRKSPYTILRAGAVAVEADTRS